MFEFGLLGPLEVRADGRSVPLGGARPRAVFAVLALHANQPVSAERLAVALWGEDAPPSAVKTVQVYVARLRKALGDPDVLVTTPAGYYLRVRRGELDVEHFERLVGEGREALATGRADDAAATLREALELWRGPPLAELSATPFAPAEITRMEEQHLAAVEVRVEADLAAGRHGELVGELQRLTGEHPWRERMHAQLMLALYRSGRQADALEAYRHAREILVEQLGIEPSAELQAVHEAILAHDPALDAPPATNGRLSDGRGTRRTPLGAPGKGKLPAPPNETIGRERDLADLTERLRASSVRLITLTRPAAAAVATRTPVAAVSAPAAGARRVGVAATTRRPAAPSHSASRRSGRGQGDSKTGKARGRGRQQSATRSAPGRQQSAARSAPGRQRAAARGAPGRERAAAAKPPAPAAKTHPTPVTPTKSQRQSAAKPPASKPMVKPPAAAHGNKKG